MWEQYKKTAMATQVLIVIVCVALLTLLQVHPFGVAVVFIAMQLSAFVGAAWAARLKRKALAPDALPLHGKL
jgi:uncharacterized membrane protein YdjX (TVP38/TMEM64 family)